MQHETDTMGFPPGVARKLVMQAYMKYETMAHGSPPKSLQSDVVVSQDDVPTVEKVVEVESDPEPHKESRATQSPKAMTLDIDHESNTNGEGKASSQKQQEVESHTKSKLGLTPADTFNGAEYETYCWSQTFSDVDLKVFVPESLKKGKDLEVIIKNNSIKVSLKSNKEAPLMDSPLVSEVKGEECMWSLHPGRYVQITLEKKVQTWWKSVFVGEPEIDQKSIDNTLNIHEMDAESQDDYRRVMFDMEQKRQGKPTIKELETQEMLKKAWNAENSPFAGSEYDPSIVNIST